MTKARWWRRLACAFLLGGAAPTALGPAAPVASERDGGLLVTVAEVGADHAVLWLRPGAGERLRVRVGDRTLEALPQPDWDDIVRLLWSADLGGAGHCRDVEDGYPIFHAMARQRADFFLFAGDTIYADHVCGGPPHVTGSDVVARTLQAFRAKHRYNRADPAVQEFLRGTAVYAIWDDHEVTNNFSGPAQALMPIGRHAFRDYWAIEGPAEEPDRLYRSVRWGRDLEVFILDTRQYRSDNARPDGADKTMLGVEQRRWLLEHVSASGATWKLIVTSVPLGIFTGDDSWTSANVLGYPRPGAGFAYERDLILRTLRDRGVAGPLAARQGFPRFLDRRLHSTSLGSLGLANNFGEILVDGDGLTAWIRDTSGAARATLHLTADTARGDAS
ncbi:MAG TPA: alkaline phosphatase D family protein [Methylomirabilota bacterium]|nr:alkaline phosphatase D family protein [Methylomirabilota bacterium]